MIKILSTFLIALVLVMGIPFFEPVTVSAVDDTILVNLTVDSGIAISTPADVTMSNIGLAVNSSTGGTSWNVISNDPDGYTLEVRASTSPAMQSGTDSFDDYTEGTPGTPDAWSVTSAYEFGFSGFGTDILPAFVSGTPTACDGGASSTINTNLRYLGFETSDQMLATKNGPTTQTGENTTICFAAEQNGVTAPSGTYQATITATALVI